jgi:hypothetical protein
MRRSDVIEPQSLLFQQESVMRTLFLAAAAATTLCLGIFAPSASTQSIQTIDEVVAAPAYNKVMAVRDLPYIEYHERVTGRLEYLESLLRSRDVSNWPEALRAERMKNIDRLHEYRLAGNFPFNYDHPGQQLPCFLDRNGNLCAVANLIAKSEGMGMVKKITSRYKYATVSEMKMPELDRWIAGSGLTRDEVITIQEPGFSMRVQVESVQPIAATIYTPTRGDELAADKSAEEIDDAFPETDRSSQISTANQTTDDEEEQ